VMIEDRLKHLDCGLQAGASLHDLAFQSKLTRPPG